MCVDGQECDFLTDHLENIEIYLHNLKVIG